MLGNGYNRIRQYLTVFNVIYLVCSQLKRLPVCPMLDVIGI